MNGVVLQKKFMRKHNSKEEVIHEKTYCFIINFGSGT